MPPDPDPAGSLSRRRPFSRISMRLPNDMRGQSARKIHRRKRAMTKTWKKSRKTVESLSKMISRVS